MTLLARGIAALSLLLLGACTATGPVQTGGDWQRQRDRVAALSHFTASGKIAMRTREQAESGSLLWQQLGSATHIRLSGPMGLAATTVDSDGRILEVRRGEEYSRWDLEDADLEGRSTWNLPLRALAYWLRGMPAPDMPVDALDIDTEAGLPQRIEQDGWVVSYGGFGEFQGYTLPTRIEANRESTRARIVLREWSDLATQ